MKVVCTGKDGDDSKPDDDGNERKLTKIKDYLLRIIENFTNCNHSVNAKGKLMLSCQGCSKLYFQGGINLETTAAQSAINSIENYLRTQLQTRRAWSNLSKSPNQAPMVTRWMIPSLRRQTRRFQAW